MTRKGDIAAFAVAGIAIFSFAVLLAFALHRLFATEAEMRRNEGDNMLWAISQAQSSALLFDLAIARRVGIPGSEPDLERRYYVLLSRLNLLSEGPQARHMERLGLSGQVDDALRAVLPLEDSVRGLSFGEVEIATAVHEVIGPLIDDLGRAANRSMVNDWEETGARLDKRRDAIVQVIVAVLAILVLGTLLSVMMVRAMTERQRIRSSLSRERETAEIYRDFVALVSHQFRTPLAIIDSSMQRLLRSRGRMPYPEIEARARQVRSEILRLTRLIAATLDVIRLDAGQVRAEPQPCDVVELVARTRARQMGATPDRVIRIELADEAPARIDTDPVLAQEILANLVSNAVKYSPATEPVVIRVSAENRQVGFCVEDRGIGVPPGEQSKLFDRFFRGSASQGLPGAGVGLAISRRLASLLGGELVFESRAGIGSSFVLKLPHEWQGGADALPGDSAS
ncbi:MAG: HAMP domain-containing histidine kinase [Burkholderiaceae bacterium]|nr:HAMP domain-containing histidine kinase [Burkholderiaceae bacterium]MEB2320239.1 HAMP domain-containing sensor histidine kinase [Pseudomonadota bacterium]